MTTVAAVFENGVFRPVIPVVLPQGVRVEVCIPDSDRATPDGLRARFPLSCGVLPPEEADEIMRVIDGEFGRVDADAWG